MQLFANVDRAIKAIQVQQQHSNNMKEKSTNLNMYSVGNIYYKPPNKCAFEETNSL